MLSKSSTYETRDGHITPVFGLGVYQALFKGEVEEAVLAAFRDGYRKIDTSPLYQNEEEIGAAIKKSGLPREEIYIVTKLWNGSHGRDATFKAFHESLNKLGVEYIDSYLIHSALGGKIVESWDAMVELQKQGLVRSIGVANFSVEHLTELKKARPDQIPAVNQIELSIYCTRAEVVEYCKNEGILVETYFPATRGDKLERSNVVELAQRYMKSTTQLMIRWVLQRGYLCVTKERKAEKIHHQGDVFDFTITDEDMEKLSGLNERCERWDCLTIPWID